MQTQELQGFADDPSSDVFYQLEKESLCSFHSFFLSV